MKLLLFLFSLVFFPGCQCEGRRRQSRGGGRVETKINEFPWMAAISNTTSFLGGGVLINTRWVLTVAHKVARHPLHELVVTLGEHDRTRVHETYYTVGSTVATMVLHSGYKSPYKEGGEIALVVDDIALLELNGDLNTGVYTPICLANVGQTFDGDMGWVIGWGYTSMEEDYSDVLRKVDFPIISSLQCKESMPVIWENNCRMNRTQCKGMEGLTLSVPDGQLCAGGDGKDACKGDGGGPLAVLVDGLYTLVGLVSWGLPTCGQAGAYGVYTEIAYYRTWIEANIGRSLFVQGGLACDPDQ